MMKNHPTFQMLLSILALSCTVFGQIGPYDFMPFNIIGGITAMSLDPDTTPSNPLRGGSITVDGLVVKIPANTIATLPAIAVAWAELFDTNGANPQRIGFEAHVIGNKVGGVNIAGLVYIAQRPAQILQGFISDINPSTGHFTVNGVDCVVDDPVGRYGAVPGTTVDSLWTSDPDNPSIHAVNGMPLCIPTNSNTATCPVKNRPLDSSGKALTTWTFPDPAKIALGSFPDPRLMVPLTIGDYVTITGTMNGGTVEVNNLIANLAIFTAPGTKPAYVSCESVNYGIVTTQAGEFAETRAVAWTTDPSVTIQWFAMDVDPCTGAVTERNLLLVQPFNTVAAPGAVPGAPLGRAVFRLGKTNVSPATRQVGFRLSTGVTQVPLGPTNLTAGQFIQPIFDFIFPEQLTFGTPAIENRFDVMPFLGLGSGPYIPGAPGAAPPTNPVAVGQLSPWPGSSPPVPTSCPPPKPPVSTPASVVSPPPATTSSSTAISPTTFPVDTVTIVSTAKKNQRGSVILTVVASTNSKNPNVSLLLSVAGVTTVTDALMTPVASIKGQFSLQVNLKGKPSTVSVRSTDGGKAGPVAA